MTQHNNTLTAAALSLGVDAADLLAVLPALQLSKQIRANGGCSIFRDTATAKVYDSQAKGESGLVSFKVTADCYRTEDNSPSTSHLHKSSESPTPTPLTYGTLAAFPYGTFFGDIGKT